VSHCHHWYRGKHLYALGRDSSNHPGIDFAQYVILPGCEKSDGTAYKWLDEREMADAPEWLYVAAKRPERESASKDAAVELDKPENIEWAEDFLRNDAPKAIEGQNGEFTKLKVAGELKDRGISEYNTDEHYEPTWDFDELRQKIANAYEYCILNQPGDKTAEADFADDDAAAVAATIKTEAKPEKIAADKLRPKTPGSCIRAPTVSRCTRLNGFGPGISRSGIILHGLACKVMAKAS
jgi:hypothetical protein